MKSDAKNISIEFEDGSTKEIKKGIAAEIIDNELTMEMIEFTPMDIVKLTYGLLAFVEKAGLTEILKGFADGVVDNLEDEDE